MSSTINSGLNNKTYICSGCKKRILKRFEVVHSPNCIVTVQPSVRPNLVPDDVYVPSTLPDRKSHLLIFPSTPVLKTNPHPRVLIGLNQYFHCSTYKFEINIYKMIEQI
jgi:hypothetical protein